MPSITMMSEPPFNPIDLWETPPIELDSELVETSQRLVAMSEKSFASQFNDETPAKEDLQDPRITELEAKNKYLFQRNVGLVAKVAELEAVNLRLQEQISDLKQQIKAQVPWYKRLFQ
jgi:hypothetical protein